MNDSRGAILVVGQPKGGVHKSSVSWEIAHAYARSGVKVCLVEGDETGTVGAWQATRENGPYKTEVSPAVVIAPRTIERTTLDMAGVHDLVVVDLGARDWDRYSTLPMAADLWLMPTDFSVVNMGPAANLFANSLWPLRARRGSQVPTRVLFTGTTTHVSGNPAGLARALDWWHAAITSITQYEPRTSADGEALAFDPATGFGVLANQLRSRPSVWEEAANRGASIAELPPALGAKALSEIDGLVAEVQALLTSGDRQ